MCMCVNRGVVIVIIRRCLQICFALFNFLIISFISSFIVFTWNWRKIWRKFAYHYQVIIIKTYNHSDVLCFWILWYSHIKVNLLFAYIFCILCIQIWNNRWNNISRGFKNPVWLRFQSFTSLMADFCQYIESVFILQAP